VHGIKFTGLYCIIYNLKSVAFKRGKDKRKLDNFITLLENRKVTVSTSCGFLYYQLFSETLEFPMLQERVREG